MKKHIIYWIIAGIVNLFTTIIHTFLGQSDLVKPMLQSNLTNQVKSELTAVWHIVTIILFATSIYILKVCFYKKKANNEFLKAIGYLYILFSIPFIVVSLINNVFAPQWILLLPIGLLILIGNRSYKNQSLSSK